MTTAALNATPPPGSVPGEAPGGRDWKGGKPFARLFVYPNGTGDPVYIPTTRVEIHSVEYEHEVAICYVKRTRDNERLLCRHLPGFVQYGRLPQQWRTMVGYVAHQEPAKVGVDPENEFAVFFIGPSWKLKEPRPFTWRDRTTDRIIREVAQFNMLGADVVLGTNVWNWASATADETQWEFLVRLCQRSGMTLVPRGTELFARRRDDITRADVERAEFFFEGLIRTLRVIVDPATEPGPTSVGIPQDLGDSGELDRRVSDPVPEPTIIEQLCGRSLEVLGVGIGDAIGVTNHPGLPTQAVEATSPFTRPPVPEGLVAADPIEEAAARRRALAFPVNALCVTDGSAKVLAGKVLRLLPSERSAWSGLWYVKSAWHVFQGVQGTGRPNRGNFVRAGSDDPPPDYFLRMELGDRDLPDPINKRPADDVDDRSPGNTPSPRNPPGDDEPGRGRPPGGAAGGGGGGGGGAITDPDQIPDTPVLVPTNPPGSTIPDDDGTVPGTLPDPPPVGLSDALPGPTCPIPPRRYLPSEWISNRIADPSHPESERPDLGPAIII